MRVKVSEFFKKLFLIKNIFGHAKNQVLSSPTGDQIPTPYHCEARVLTSGLPEKSELKYLRI